MYLEAQRLKKVIQQVIDLSSELDEKRAYLHPLNQNSENDINFEQQRLSIDNIKHKLSGILNKLSTRELIILRSIHDIGHSERGYRIYSNSQEIETFIIDIQGTPQELLDKYSKYLIYQTKEQLIKYFTQRRLTSQYLIEGIKILDL